MRPKAALEEGLDVLEDGVDGLWHLEGGGVAIQLSRRRIFRII